MRAAIAPRWHHFVRGGNFRRYGKTNLGDSKINASVLSVGFGGNCTLSGTDVLQAAVDIYVAIFPMSINFLAGTRSIAEIAISMTRVSSVK